MINMILSLLLSKQIIPPKKTIQWIAGRFPIYSIETGDFTTSQWFPQTSDTNQMVSAGLKSNPPGRWWIFHTNWYFPIAKPIMYSVEWSYLIVSISSIFHPHYVHLTGEGHAFPPAWSPRSPLGPTSALRSHLFPPGRSGWWSPAPCRPPSSENCGHPRCADVNSRNANKNQVIKTDISQPRHHYSSLVPTFWF